MQLKLGLLKDEIFAQNCSTFLKAAIARWFCKSGDSCPGSYVSSMMSHHHLVRETSVVTESREAVRIRQALKMKMNGNFIQNFPTPQTWDYKLLCSMSSPPSSSSTSWAPTPRLASAHWWRGPKPRQAPAPSPLFRPCCSRFTLLATPPVVVVDVFEYVLLLLWMFIWIYCL